MKKILKIFVYVYHNLIILEISIFSQRLPMFEKM